MAKQQGLIAAYRLDGHGGAKRLEWPDVDTWEPGDGILWVHCDLAQPETIQALLERSSVSAEIRGAIVAENTRPRVVEADKVMALVLRGVNLNPGADPEDMVSIRILLEERRIVSARFRSLLATGDIETALENGHGPRSVAGFVAMLADSLISRMEPVISDLEERVAAFEDEVFSGERSEDRPELNRIRTEVIKLRRYLKPQMEVLMSLRLREWTGFDKKHKGHLATATDHATRYVENLDALHERLLVVHDEFRYLQNERMNRTMYVLTVFAAVLLPPSLIAGILGANVGGIPGVENPMAFATLVLGIIALGGFELWLLRRLKWI